MTDSNIPPSHPFPSAHPSQPPEDGASIHGYAPPEPDGASAEWETVNFPGTLPLAQIPDPPLPEAAPPQPTETVTSRPADFTHREAELLQLIQDLNQCNDALLRRVAELEEALERSQTALQIEVERSQQNQSASAAEAQVIITQQQQQVAQLLSELDMANDAVRRTSIHNETLQADLDTTRQRVAQLERECTLLQQRFTEKNTTLAQAEATCRDLRSRLQRQQHYTLQFKAALEKCLDMASHRPSATTESRGAEIAAAEPPQVARPQPVAMPRAQQIQPWSADETTHRPDPTLDNLLRGLKSVGQRPTSPPQPTFPWSSAPMPPVTPPPPPEAEAETVLWQDLARIMEASAARAEALQAEFLSLEMGQEPPAQPDSSQSHGTQLSLVAPELLQSELPQSELPQSELPHPELPQPDLSQSELSQSELSQSELNQPELNQPKFIEPNGDASGGVAWAAVHPPSVHPPSAPPQAAPPEQGQPGMAQLESPPSGPVSSTRGKPKAPKLKRAKLELVKPEAAKPEVPQADFSPTASSPESPGWPPAPVPSTALPEPISAGSEPSVPEATFAEGAVAPQADEIPAPTRLPEPTVPTAIAAPPIAADLPEPVFTEPSPWGTPLNSPAHLNSPVNSPPPAPAPAPGSQPSSAAAPPLESPGKPQIPVYNPPAHTPPVGPPLPLPGVSSQSSLAAIAARRPVNGLPPLLDNPKSNQQSPSPVVYPLRPPKKLKSLAAVELPDFSRKRRSH